ncbi:MAG: hypothetical protein CL946_03645, partial [Ectothiorhodospiraceae bacterium]|nr:hypothetical protein [Ectothiorhodospiraceae bacterium]
LSLPACDSEEDLSVIGGFLDSTANIVRYWEPVARPFNRQIYDVAITGSGTLYIAVQARTVHRSDDFGRTWVPDSTGTPADFAAQNVTTFGNHVAAYSDTAIFIKFDGSGSWVDAHSGIPAGAKIQFIERDETASLFAATDSGLYSFNQSASIWTKIENGLPRNTGIRDIAFHSSGYAVALTDDNDVYISESGRQNWLEEPISWQGDSVQQMNINDRRELLIVLFSGRLLIHTPNGLQEPVQRISGEDVYMSPSGLAFIVRATVSSSDEFSNDERDLGVARSIDGGLNWLSYSGGINDPIRDIAFDAAGNGFAVSTLGTVFRTLVPVSR